MEFIPKESTQSGNGKQHNRALLPALSGEVIPMLLSFVSTIVSRVHCTYLTKEKEEKEKEENTETKIRLTNK